jgi:hypothetical protein
LALWTGIRTRSSLPRAPGGGGDARAMRSRPAGGAAGFLRFGLTDGLDFFCLFAIT